MEFTINRDLILKPLSHACGIIEKKTTIPILSNILIEVKESKIKITATDLDIIYSEEIPLQDLKTEGTTTTSATILHDILRKLDTNAKVEFTLQDSNKLKLKSGNSKFNLLCMPSDSFPVPEKDTNLATFEIQSAEFLKLLNKTKISISNDETRHYLNGIYIHNTEANGKIYLTGVATDSHRLSSSSMPLANGGKLKSFILPKKTVFQLCSLLEDSGEKISLFSSDTKIQFKIGNSKITSKIIDGKFPDYRKVVPQNNSKVLSANVKDLINSVERVITVSIDRKEGVKLTLDKNNIQLFVNSSSSGEGKETLSASYNAEQLTVSFNSRYLLDIASEIEDEKITVKLNDAVSPVLIQDNSDKYSYYVIMPMKI